MKLTKFQHACFTVEKDAAVLIIDPGTFTHDFIIPHRVDGIIITHDHPDHFDKTLVTTILQAHPKAVLIADASITTQFTSFSTVAITVTEPYTLGPFLLQFFGGQHAPIAPTVATPANFGVLIDDSLYYPGDSFTVPVGKAVDVLALPVSAPWLDFARICEFLAAVHPRLAFPTHNGILSTDGKNLAAKMVGGFAESQGIIYTSFDGLEVTL